MAEPGRLNDFPTGGSTQWINLGLRHLAGDSESTFNWWVSV